ncbi:MULTISPECIES: BlaI/MecI/CopY family transcriptional regulator [Actinomycetes]|uniref:CopY family transcriptional regulator n=1 Tax=Mycolicibacterium neoaurum VKM Ac-1815D TaxID=700508 RepID=V5X9D1_MYCNE|nr:MULTISPECIES: BlaI/MecI/CopY family transcriptional regulator [Actinomycetes]AHC25040.1 CopY family transcriptional regulator [Mycolicibacterium neoaurum VKM Ac-1815D]AMO08241.1 CopY family transcriptional regulator [Mycolicibacterium neoaurum]AXK78428.1 BlaI/MecI/CopY family transcriptional regulator [Mycolicibacterium neoaurum]KJQ50867.1 CopY family transcriptional regulator [Mycolicibacterium neoaurum]KUM09774.1 CopY family transcriptional regulator [Mycolicibacterium neoaurum]
MQQRGLGDLEATVMDRVWASADGATVRDIFEQLADARQIAYTTVLSTMDNLYRKGWVRRDREGKAYRYWPTMTREERSAQLMRAAFDSGGDAEAVLAFFVDQMSAEESAKLRAALRHAPKRQR